LDTISSRVLHTLVFRNIERGNRDWLEGISHGRKSGDSLLTTDYLANINHSTMGLSTTAKLRRVNSGSETPLLSSSGSSTAGGSGEDGDGSDGEFVARNGNGDGKVDGASNQSVTGLRACFIIAGLGTMVFLQGMLSFPSAFCASMGVGGFTKAKGS